MAGPAGDIASNLQELREFLIRYLHFTEDEASAYAFGLEKLTITSGDVSRRFPETRTNTAKDTLERLAGRGLFKETPRKGEPSNPGRGKGYVTFYRVVPPDQAFASFFGDTEKFKENVLKIGEHLEVKAEEPDQYSSEIWLTRPQKIATAQGASIIRSASKSVKIYGHDCTWLGDIDLQKALVGAATRKIGVDIIATSLPHALEKFAIRAGLRHKTTQLVTIPFCIVDDTYLLIPHTTGQFEKDFALLSTTNRYMVGNFVKTFESLNEKEVRAHDGRNTDSVNGGKRARQGSG